MVFDSKRKHCRVVHVVRIMVKLLALGGLHTDVMVVNIIVVIFGVIIFGVVIFIDISTQELHILRLQIVNRLRARLRRWHTTDCLFRRLSNRRDGTGGRH